MHTSSRNKIKKDKEVTPDAVIQFSNSLGLITETKASLPENKEFWRKETDQFLKYNDNLKGWWTPDEFIANYNVIVLIEVARSLEYRSYLLDLQTKGEITLDDTICGISFVRAKRLTEQIYFEPKWGRIKDPTLAKKLVNGISIPLEKVKATYGNIKFYDHESDIEYLISVMWNDVFITKKNDTNFDPESKRYLIDIDVNSLARELQRSFGCIAIRRVPSNLRRENQREVEFPRITWVRKALVLLVKIGYAQKRTEDSYTILYRLIRKDLIEHFAAKRIKEEKKKQEEKEPMLFNEDDFIN